MYELLRKNFLRKLFSHVNLTPQTKWNLFSSLCKRILATTHFCSVLKSCEWAPGSGESGWLFWCPFRASPPPAPLAPPPPPLLRQRGTDVSRGMEGDEVSVVLLWSSETPRNRYSRPSRPWGTRFAVLLHAAEPGPPSSKTPGKKISRSFWVFVFVHVFCDRRNGSYGSGTLRTV